MKKRSMMVGMSLLALIVLSIKDRPAQAYVEIPYTLGRVCNEATNICVMRVEKVDKERNLIIFTKVADLKGKHPADTIKHNIGRGGFAPREWQFIMAAAEPGKTAIFFHNGSASETCIDNYWNSRLLDNDFNLRTSFDSPVAADRRPEWHHCSGPDILQTFRQHRVRVDVWKHCESFFHENLSRRQCFHWVGQ